MTTAYNILLLLSGAIFAYVVLGWTSQKPYPPGPPSLPGLGVARIHPKTEFWKTYAEWGRKYVHINEQFKMYRKMMHRTFNPDAAQIYWEIQAQTLVDNIVKYPEKVVEHLQRDAAAVIMKIAYGYTVSRNNDHFVALAEEHMRLGSLVSAPGKWLVDSLPFRKYGFFPS
ncbi:hypothetical protein B0H17DRAFT_1128638 [Mycena rosella]|uniref:Cytochrome P450 n=1 Tax=Mycena rosella TaxID=1033263 RepID=A0AAD7GLM1_MYCRO|nr:hypothetical protein B0H17DRAFT_1128638 [Mycena rosella]